MQAFPQDNRYTKIYPSAGLRQRNIKIQLSLYSYVCQLDKAKEQFLVKLTKYSEYSHVRIAKYMESGS